MNPKFRSIPRLLLLTLLVESLPAHLHKPHHI